MNPSKFIILVPIVLAIASSTLSLSLNSIFIWLGWVCLVCLCVYLYINQKGDLFWKLLSVVSAYFLFVGLRILFMEFSVLIEDSPTGSFTSSFITLLIGLAIVFTGKALYERKEKALFFSAVISILFLTSTLNSIVQAKISILELPAIQIVRIFIWSSIIGLLIIRVLRKEKESIGV